MRTERVSQDMHPRQNIRLSGGSLHFDLHNLLRQRLRVVLADHVWPTQMSRLLQERNQPQGSMMADTPSGRPWSSPAIPEAR
jgi:hypothetical protein